MNTHMQIQTQNAYIYVTDISGSAEEIHKIDEELRLS